MRPPDFEARMRAGECFHDVRMLPAAWAVLRLDGHGFTRFTGRRYEKPFDAAFHDQMIAAAGRLLERFQGLYAYTESDEISILLPRGWDLFDRELEKAASLSASLAGSVFSIACGEPVQFDSRVWLGARDEDVVDYFRWRQADATRCALNGWSYWTLRKAGRNAAEATAALHGKPVGFKHDLLRAHGIYFNDLPLWQRRGTGLYWERFAKEGFDPIRGVAVSTIRRRLKVDRELPMKREYGLLVGRLMDGAGSGDSRRTA
ncbi:tRNAHis guanylyltransferase [Aquisphaera giovannonii]|uniref:tRNA(His) guanylyltransferase n=1 Tax=Aquisphaera giovannonii TaxID=406548 RepID=A0A5B9W6N6_9BACT|nr:tRNA(His) guanylyltransferase Thg1 family protein [Aquisphaera giovannonii]QEH36326.1 tRNAHis guanylyltransferase [Aquisphaera giovannonii]